VIGIPSNRADDDVPICDDADWYVSPIAVFDDDQVADVRCPHPLRGVDNHLGLRGNHDLSVANVSNGHDRFLLGGYR
jgi:hypothetical protein